MQSNLLPQPETLPEINDLDFKAQRTLVLGTTGTGKTTLASRLIDLHPADLILIYDWQGGEFRHRLGVGGAYRREQVLDQISDGKRIICYDAEKGETDPEREGWDWWCTMCLEISKITPGQKLVVADEGQSLVTPNKVPQSMKDMLARGRRARLHSLILACAANALHNSNRDQVNEVYCFRSIDDNALEYPRSIGLDPADVSALPDCEFLYRDLRTGRKTNLALWSEKSNGSINP